MELKDIQNLYDKYNIKSEIGENEVIDFELPNTLHGANNLAEHLDSTIFKTYGNSNYSHNTNVKSKFTL